MGSSVSKLKPFMAKLQFSGKAETLQRLQGTLLSAKVLPQLHFNLKAWFDADGQWENLGLQAEWLSQSVIVRSSARTEDHHQHSMAGQFLSIADVQGIEAIEAAVRLLIKSYGDDDPDHQVLIQPMVRHIRLSGVAFSYEPGQTSPYYVINYDDESNSGHFVTQGLGQRLKLTYIAKSAEPDLSGWKKQLLSLLKELEDLFENDAIDVEFIVTSDDELILLQVRPLVLPAERPVTIIKQKHELTQLKQRFKQACQKSHQCLGQDNLWGVMPDWNPAEIIGLRPKPLAYSLYQQLVTDTVWAQQRFDYGYRDVRGIPLMLDVCGMPYIDIRASFNSFIPKQLPDDLATRLVTFYLHRLKNNPQWHDKVEFKVVLASDHFSLNQALQTLLKYGFSKNDCNLLQNSLVDLTRKIIDKNQGLWLHEIQKVQQLPVLHKQIMSSQLDEKNKLRSLLTLCREYGTRPFAGLARTAFLAVHFLQSLVNRGVLSAENQVLFMRSLSTVSSDLIHAIKTSSRNHFLQKYGHMRPGTYDLLSPRYDEIPDDYFCWNSIPHCKKGSLFVLNKKQETQIEVLLKQHEYEFTASEFISFIRQAIEWREKAKFIFSQTLSEILLLCQKLGQQYQLERQDTAFLKINQMLRLSSADAALDLVAKAQHQFTVTRSLILPPLITQASDIDCFEIQPQQPNFITLKRVTAQVMHLLPDSRALSGQLAGKIVIVAYADPGHDWLFTHRIVGLITLYGGCNSHMAIRAAELGLPAVIGIGEALFHQCSKAKLLTLDCEQKIVYRLQ